MKLIPFNKSSVVGREREYVLNAMENKTSADGKYTDLCQSWFEDRFCCKKTLLVTSCTDALEMAATLINTKPGDEVIVPSYTFPTSALSFVMRGAIIKFVDIDPKTMNIDVNKIEEAITSKTIAIVPVHYAGVSCDMDKIMDIAKRHNLYVIEDAAQGVMSTYKGKALGTIGHIGCFSFHETKNYSSGEGGLILLNDETLIERAEMIRDCGTNAAQFFRGQIPSYCWTDLGSSHLMSELNAAYLYGQIECAEDINNKRLLLWDTYYQELSDLTDKIELPYIPNDCKHNAHMFYIKTKDFKERSALINYLKENNIKATFHYIPLHSSTGGKKYGEMVGHDEYTTIESERLLRLPLFYELSIDDVKHVCSKIKDFYNK